MEENMKKPAGGLGIAALVLGIVSLVFCWIWFISIICGLVGLVLGIVAIAQKRKLGMPLTGAILSLVGIILSIVLIVAVVGIFGKAVDEYKDLSNFDRNSYTNSLYNYNTNNTYNSIYDNSYSSNSLLNSTTKNNIISNTTSTNTLNNTTGINTSSSSYDKVSGYSYVEKNDNSLLELNSNGSFKYYKNKDVLNDYYYEGTYEVYTGTKLKNWLYNGGTLSETYKNTFDNLTEDQWNQMYMVTLNNSKQIVNGQNALENPNTAYYVGTYDDSSKTLSVVNISSAEVYNFVKK